MDAQRIIELEDELRRVSGELKSLKKTSDHCVTADRSPSAVHEPISPTVVNEDEVVEDFPAISTNRRSNIFIDVHNKCAKAILDHEHERVNWKRYNHIDDPAVHNLIHNDNHYLLYANKSKAKYADGKPVQCMTLMRYDVIL
jgi:hypothetical protein